MSCPFRFAVLALATTVATALSAAGDTPRPVAAILKEIEESPVPEFDRRKKDDAAAVKAFVASREAVLKRRGELALELFQADPDNSKLIPLFAQRWDPPPYDESRADEVERVLARTKNPALRAEALYGRIHIVFDRNPENPELTLPSIEEFVRSAPTDPRCPNLFFTVGLVTKDARLRSSMEDRILKDYPDSIVGKSAAGRRRAAAMVGRPFELSFQDAVTGGKVSVERLRGKVIVVDFWATWCGPCVEEIPAMKALYAKYKDRGVEFIGVSLDGPEDEGGLEAVKKFVAKHDVTWPQFYQGGGWESGFSASLGIDSIPQVFVVAADGTLASTDARGKLDKLIPDLLAARDKPAR